MNLTDRIQDLVAEIGPLRDYMAVASYPEDSLWRVLVDEDLIVEIEMDEAAGVIVLSGSAGTPPAGRDLNALHEMMLDYGAIWRQSSGLQLARDADGSYLALLRHGAADLDRTRLAALVDRFADWLRAWRTIVANPIAAMAGKASDDFDPSLAAGFIRG
jgi:hypothetical protein